MLAEAGWCWLVLAEAGWFFLEFLVWSPSGRTGSSSGKETRGESCEAPAHPGVAWGSGRWCLFTHCRKKLRELDEDYDKAIAAQEREQKAHKLRIAAEERVPGTATAQVIKPGQETASSQATSGQPVSSSVGSKRALGNIDLLSGVPVPSRKELQKCLS